MLREFSTRRREIEMHLEEHGESGPRAAQVAAYATRRAKDGETPAETLVGTWQERAQRLGLDERALSGMLERCVVATVPCPGSVDAERLFEQLAAPTGLTARSASFGQREVLQAVSAAAPNGGDVDEILALGDAFLTSEHVVALDRSGLRTSDVLRRRDGTVVVTHVDKARWSTPEMLATEARLIDAALQRRDDGVAIAGRDQVRAAIRTRPGLAREQIHTLRRITESGAGVDVVEGAAGTGKTYLLDAAREAWETSGSRVIGCALAARAAAELEHGAGIPSVTLDRLLRHLDRAPKDGRLDSRTVVVVDEASMVGTRKLDRLLDHARSAGAKVVLVGDHYQLPEIDAGGAFVGLAARLDAAQLLKNRRQIEPWERAALTQLRTGDAHVAFAAYQTHDRIRHDYDGERLRDRLVDDWSRAHAAGHDAIMLATRNTDVDDLNHRARQQLQHAGMLGPDQLDIAGRRYAIGDRVLTTRNDYHLGVLNGTRATITHLDPSTGTIHARTDTRDVALPWQYAANGHLTHGYAMTFHKAQGMTVHSTFILADDTLDRPHAYTGLSRGTHHNTLYITEPSDQHADERHTPQPANDTVARARESMARMTGKTMATDQRQRALTPPTTPSPEPAREPPGLGPDLGP